MGHRSGARRAEEWAIAPLAVKAEELLTNHARRAAFVQFAYRYFYDSIDIKTVFGGHAPENYDALVFIAVHRMLLKSDSATIRYSMLERYQATPAQFDQFVTLNQHLDKLIEDDAVEKLGRIVNRRGAPDRIASRSMCHFGRRNQNCC